MFEGHIVMKGMLSSSLTIQKYLMDNTMCQAAGQMLEGTVMTPLLALASLSQGRCYGVPDHRVWCFLQTSGADF